MKAFIAFVAGIVFAVGLAVAGMTQPSKVVGFLDFFGDWDPSLAFVMGGAVLVNAILYRLTVRRKQPLLEPQFHIPTRSDLDWRLILGGVFFGVGWGLAGFCPGPAVTSLATGTSNALIFGAAMLAGIAMFKFVDRRNVDSPQQDAPEESFQASSTD